MMIPDSKKEGYLYYISLVAMLTATILGIVFTPGPKILWTTDACYDKAIACGIMPLGLVGIVAGVVAITFAAHLLFVPKDIRVDDTQ